MASADVSVLMVGLAGPTQTWMITKMEQRGWRCRAVQTLSSAFEALRSGKAEIVLAAELLPDGRGYDLMDAVACLSCSLLVGVMISEGYLWLPAVERGERTLGQGGVGPIQIESVVGELVFKTTSAGRAGAAGSDKERGTTVCEGKDREVRRKSAVIR